MGKRRAPPARRDVCRKKTHHWGKGLVSRREMAAELDGMLSAVGDVGLGEGGVCWRSTLIRSGWRCDTS